MKYVITEAEKREILGLYGIVREEFIPRPLQILKECKFTSDGKFIIYEDIAYSCETGEQVPLNEAWTLSDTLHTIGDVASMGLDFVVPGSGAIVDVINAISYFIEAQFAKDSKKRDSLYVMGAITFAFVAIPGALQAVSIPLKTFVRTGKLGTKSPLILKGIKIIGDKLDSILSKLPEWLQKVLKTKLGGRVLGKYGTYLNKYLKTLANGIRVAFKRIEKEAIEAGAKGASKSITREVLDVVSQRSLLRFLRRKTALKMGAKSFQKAGFVAGKSYTYISKQGPIKVVLKEVTDVGVSIVGKTKGGKTFTAPMSHDMFLRNAIAAPWLRKGKSVRVPFFVKRFANLLLPDGGGYDLTKEKEWPDADPDQTSQESLSYYMEGDGATDDQPTNKTQNVQRTASQPVQPTKPLQTSSATVRAFQDALASLGYALPAINGTFDSKTQYQLGQFQLDYQLESSAGKMDRATAQMLARALQRKNVQGSEQLQSTLNSF